MSHLGLPNLNSLWGQQCLIHHYDSVQFWSVVNVRSYPAHSAVGKEDQVLVFELEIHRCTTLVHVWDGALTSARGCWGALWRLASLLFGAWSFCFLVCLVFQDGRGCCWVCCAAHSAHLQLIMWLPRSTWAYKGSLPHVLCQLVANLKQHQPGLLESCLSDGSIDFKSTLQTWSVPGASYSFKLTPGECICMLFSQWGRNPPDVFTESVWCPQILTWLFQNNLLMFGWCRKKKWSPRKGSKSTYMLKSD